MSEHLTSSGVGAVSVAIDSRLVAQRAAEHVPCDAFYDLATVQRFVNAGGYTTVALQFPDFLLPDAPSVLGALEEALPEVEWYILADATFNPFCVDEVAAAHIDAQAVIHFGPASITRAANLPVLYDLGRAPVDVWRTASALWQAAASAPADGDGGNLWIVVADSMFDWAVSAIATQIQAWASASTAAAHRDLVVLPAVAHKQFSAVAQDGAGGAASSESRTVTVLGSQVQLPPGVESLEQAAFLYVGAPGARTDVLCMRYPMASAWIADGVLRPAGVETASEPTLISAEPCNEADAASQLGVRTGRALARRYAAVERVKLAERIGVVVGTLSTADYTRIVQALRRIIAAAGRAVYILHVGRLNVAKVANFGEMDAFVLVTDPEASLLPDEVAREFPAPVVTPWEAVMALHDEVSWTGDITVDFEEVLARIDAAGGLPGHAADEAERTDETRAAGGDGSHSDDDADAPEWNLAAGGLVDMRSKHGTGDTETAGGSLAIVKSEGGAIVQAGHAAASIFSQREWQGMDPSVPKDASLDIRRGQHGVARDLDGK